MVDKVGGRHCQSSAYQRQQQSEWVDSWREGGGGGGGGECLRMEGWSLTCRRGTMFVDEVVLFLKKIVVL